MFCACGAKEWNFSSFYFGGVGGGYLLLRSTATGVRGPRPLFSQGNKFKRRTRAFLRPPGYGVEASNRVLHLLGRTVREGEQLVEGRRAEDGRHDVFVVSTTRLRGGDAVVIYAKTANTRTPEHFDDKTREKYSTDKETC